VSRDDWMEDATLEVDYRTLIDWDGIDPSGGNPVTYGRPASRFVDRRSGSCDVTRTVEASPPLPLPEKVAMIALDDLY
jgi:hypothetical protein